MGRIHFRDENGNMRYMDDDEYEEYLRKKELERGGGCEIEIGSGYYNEGYSEESEYDNEGSGIKVKIKSCINKIVYFFFGLLVFFFIVGYCSRNDEKRSTPKEETTVEVKEKKSKSKTKSPKGKKSKKGNRQNDIKPLKTSNEAEEISTKEADFEETSAKDDINNREGHLDEKPIEPSHAESQIVE